MFPDKVCSNSPRNSKDKLSIILSLFLFQKDDPYMLESMTEVKERKFKLLEPYPPSEKLLSIVLANDCAN